MVYLSLLRRPILTWGADASEAAARLPGDELLEDADGVATRAIWIDAPASAVWPWLAQMGPSPRGGAYTYDWIENLLGLNMHSVDRVLPEFQHPRVGDTIAYGTNRMRVERVEGEHVLAWRSEDGNWVWTFVLDQVGERTRLISRNRFRLPTVAARLGMFPMEPASLVMERKMLRGIKQRAERLATAGAESAGRGWSRRSIAPATLGVSRRLDDARRTAGSDAGSSDSCAPPDHAPSSRKSHEVLRATSGSLHRDQVRAGADVETVIVELGVDGVAHEVRMRELAWDAGDPLHDVEAAETRRQDEVAAFGELSRIERVVRELRRIEVAEAVMLRVEFSQECRETLEVGGVGRRDDVDVLRRAREAVRSDGQAADQHVLDARVGQRGDQLIWGEHPTSRRFSSSSAATRLRRTASAKRDDIERSAASRRSASRAASFCRIHRSTASLSGIRRS